MKSLRNFCFALALVAVLFTSCQTEEEKNEKEVARHQANFLNSTPPPMSKPQ
jgi:hypothetical protein